MALFLLRLIRLFILIVATVSGVGNNHFSPAVEQWRPLVEVYFEPDHVHWALHTIGCESGGNADAKNPTSTASGLFQHLGSLWPSRSAAVGWMGADIFDPQANIAVGAWLLEDAPGGGRQHWPRCGRIINP